MTKYKNVPFTKQIIARLKAESKLSGISGNAIVIIAVDEFLKKKEKERKKEG